jgi:hypothetical protein
MRYVSAVLVLCTAACGRGSVVVSGDVASDGAAAPDGVWATEVGRHAALDDGRFELSELAAGPLSLRLLAEDDTVGVMDLGGLPRGTRLHLAGIRVDRRSGRAFPRTVEVEGTDAVTINGVRMAPDERLPREVDAAGTVLALDMAAGALLMRPDDERIADLRVIVTLATEVATSDGDPVQPELLARGDSVRVEGISEAGFVIATRLLVPRGAAVRESGRGTPSTPAASAPPQRAAPQRAPPRPAAAPARPPEARPDPPGRSGDAPGRGRGRGQNRGRGNG